MAKRNGMTAAQKHPAAHKPRRLDRDAKRIRITGDVSTSGSVQALPRVIDRGFMGHGSFMFADATGDLYIANTEHGTISRPKLV
jgi:hypothetical protein